jgi:hypothetical protein
MHILDGWQWLVQRTDIRISAALLLLFAVSPKAGPPFVTDDPDPIEYHCWGFYIASQLLHFNHVTSGTAPHVEIDYGCIPNAMLHAIVPLAFRSEDHCIHYGLGDVEVGFIYRFFEKSGIFPEIGLFPLFELPTGNGQQGLGEGFTQVFFPVWLKKAWEKIEAYGGAGYETSLGNNRSHGWFFGGVFQYDFSARFSSGAELFHHWVSDGEGGETGCNVGCVFSFTNNQNLLFSIGRDFSGPNNFLMYIGYLFTIEP